jgi:hypothetical protein
MIRRRPVVVPIVEEEKEKENEVEKKEEEEYEVPVVGEEKEEKKESPIMLLHFPKEEKKEEKKKGATRPFKGETAEAFNYRKEFMSTLLEKISAFQVSKHRIDLKEAPKLIGKLNAVVDIYKYIIQHAEYIATNPAFRIIVKSRNGSFMQTAIRNCVSLQTEIYSCYEKVRLTMIRADPELRSLKHTAQKCVTDALKVLCKLYVENPVESEPVEELLC